MGDNTAIAWTEATWNPLVGCSVLTPGCTSCYAMREAHKLASWPMSKEKYGGLTRETKGGPVWTGEVRLWEPAIEQPLRWRKGRMIFVNSMSDLFHEAVPDAWIDRVFTVMAMAPQHIFQVLTKRAERMHAYMKAAPPSIGTRHYPLSNVWLGISAEDERRWDERVPLLLDTPNAMPWVSVEPQLECVDRDPSGLRWIVQGGESGKPRLKARPFDIEWCRVMRDRCNQAGVAYFNKQLGSMAQLGNRPYPTKHYAGADPEEWPADIQIREYPNRLL